jgi:predicted dehydrogenase
MSGHQTMQNESPSPLRAAIVGVGQAEGQGSPTGGAYRIGHVHAKAYQRSDRFDLVSAADINPVNLKFFQTTFGLDDGHPSLQAMLDQVKPDVVSICTYVGLHLSMIEACAAAGVRGVICEKPFVASPAELARLRDLVRESGLRILVPHFRRYLPAFIDARDAYRSGEVGERVIVTAAIGDGWDLSEWGSHWLDMFRFFHEDAMPDFVLAQARVGDRRGFGHAMEEHAAALMQFPDGGRAVIEVGPAYLPGGANMILTGTRGVIVVRSENNVTIYSAKGESHRSHAERTDFIGTWTEMFDTLADWIATGTEPPLGFSHVAGTAELNLGCYMSMVRGDRVDFPMPSDHAEWPVEELARRSAARGIVASQDRLAVK